MAESSVENGRIITWMAMGSISGTMVGSMKGSINLIRRKALDVIPGLMEGNTLDTGTVASNTELASINYQMKKTELGSGKMEKGSYGLRSSTKSNEYNQVKSISNNSSKRSYPLRLSPCNSSISP